jgi:hypothetical protein
MDAADEAGASEGASLLIHVLGRHEAIRAVNGRELLLLTGALVLTCRASEEDLPTPPDLSYDSAVSRGTHAADPDGLREAVVRAFLKELPTRDKPLLPAPRELCLGVHHEEPTEDWDSPHWALPPPIPCPFHDPTSPFLDRFADTRVRVVAASTCSVPLASIETGSILRYSADEPEYYILADVLLGPVGYGREYTAVHTTKGWTITGCRTHRGACPSPE